MAEWAPNRYAVTALLGALLLAACSGDNGTGNVVEVEAAGNEQVVDRDAYAEERLASGAVTLIDAAIPDGVLLPPDHSGPTLGEIRLAQRERAAAARNAAGSNDDEEDVANDAPRPAPPPRPAEPPTPVLEVEPVVTQ